jgi:hypothetical protein
LAPRRPALFAWAVAASAVAAGIFLKLDTEIGKDDSQSVRFCVDVTGAPWYFRPGDPIQKAGWIYGNCPFGESVAVADYIKQHSNPGDTVFVYGSEPQIPYYAGRKSASRYIFVYPLMTPFADTRDRQAVVLEELQQNRPRFIVVARQDSSFFDDDKTPLLLQEGLTKLLTDKYCLVGYAAVGDTALRPFAGKIVIDDVPRPKVEHTLALWERVAR